MPIQMTVTPESFPIAGTFTISRGSKTEAKVVTVRLTDGVHVGQGECVPYGRYGETVESVLEVLSALVPEVAAGLDPKGLQSRLKPGAARNALDCAFWDLEAKRSGTNVAALIAAPPPARRCRPARPPETPPCPPPHTPPPAPAPRRSGPARRAARATPPGWAILR